jgi:hypothetical protein
MMIFGKRYGWFSSKRDNALNGEGTDGRAYMAIRRKGPWGLEG